MLGGVQPETGGLGPVPYLNILGGTSQKNTLYLKDNIFLGCHKRQKFKFAKWAQDHLQKLSYLTFQ